MTDGRRNMRPAPSVRVSRRRLSPVVALSLLLLTACVYIPTPEHASVEAARITEADKETLEPFVTTRADVLLRFGDPTERHEDDRFSSITGTGSRATSCGGSGRVRQGSFRCRTRICSVWSSRPTTD